MAVFRTRARGRGYSLIELMVGIGVTAILLAVAVPGFTNAIRNNRVRSASNTLVANLAYARAEAVTRGTIVAICPSVDGASCVAAGQAYETGWLIYSYEPGYAVSDKDYDNSPSAHNVLLRHVASQPGVSIRAGAGGSIRYGSQGELRAGATAASGDTQVAFDICYRSAASGVGESGAAVPGVQLTLQGSGSVSTSRMASGSVCAP
jgi:type IV fimbrial biogenesis protein FimT